jgi:serine/threonine protein kinase/tetratricopeptide (TPR) repeat protein
VSAKSEEAIFSTAIGFEDPVERQAYVARACGDDASLRAKVEALLRAHDSQCLLDVPVIGREAIEQEAQLSEGPGTAIGRYKLLEKVGEGGMAVVYMAEQREPIRRKVALKVIKLGMDTKQVIARLEAERQALAMMDHPNIAQVFDAGTTESGRPYFVMELVRGVSITEYCDQNSLSTRERLELFVSVCQAVHHAHQKGIIHRDIKPSNVMVTLHDGRPVAKVIDFGIAKATDQRLTEKTLFTRYAQMIGTPQYMSPEQAEMSGLDVDTRTDVFSLGVLLYELLTGTTPFDSEYLLSKGYGELQRIIREEEPTRPSTKLSTLGEALTSIAKCRRTSPEVLHRLIRTDLDWIVMKTLEKDRNRRYDSVSELTADVNRHLDNQPVLARRPSALYRMKKFVQRRRTMMMVTGAVGATLLIGLVASTLLYVRVKRATGTVATLDRQMEADRRLFTAQRLYAEGRYGAALTEMENQGLSGTPEPKAQLLRAQILLDLGRDKDAEAQLKLLLSAEPEIAGSAHHLLARIYRQTDPVKSKEHGLQAEELLPQSADGYVLRALASATPDEALKWLDQALQLNPSDYASRKARALVYYGLRDYANMLHDADTLIAVRPKDPLGYTLRALARRETGELRDSLSDQDRAIELCQMKTELPSLLDERRETYWRLGDYESALRDAEQCVALAPETLAYRAALGKILFKLRQYEAARQEFAQVQAGQGALWQAVRTMLGYAFDAANAGEVVEIPDSLSNVWPFLHMPKYVDLHAQLTRKAAPLVRGAFDMSSWSPDGRQLAYARSEFCGWDDNPLEMAGSESPVVARGIEILDLESGHTRLLVTSGGGPSWSPDGQYIAYVRASEMTTTGPDAEVWLIPALGGEPRRLAQGAYPSWTNDPTRLYFLSRLHEAVYRIDITDATAEPVYVAACPGWYPEVSPDERYLAYAVNGELTIVDLPSGKTAVHWVVPGPEKYCCVHWSPDAKEISVSSLGLRDYCSGLWIFDFERRQGWHLLDSEAICCNWSKDRSRIALDLFFPVNQIWTARVDPNLPTWQALAPLQTRSEYLRSYWPRYVASYARAWPDSKPAVIGNLTAVGVNQYDCGEHEDALWTLQHVAELSRSQGLQPDMDTSAHIVMALYRMGRGREATESLHQLRQMVERSEDPNAARCLYELEQSIAHDKAGAE